MEHGRLFYLFFRNTILFTFIISLFSFLVVIIFFFREAKKNMPRHIVIKTHHFENNYVDFTGTDSSTPNKDILIYNTSDTYILRCQKGTCSSLI